jgi:hypothetical protein
MCHRIRYALAQKSLFMTGTVEIDETYIGGRTKGKKRKLQPGEQQPDNLSPVHNKAPVVALVQRGGNVQSHYAP